MLLMVKLRHRTEQRIENHTINDGAKSQIQKVSLWDVPPCTGSSVQFSSVLGVTSSVNTIKSLLALQAYTVFPPWEETYRFSFSLTGSQSLPLHI